MLLRPGQRDARLHLIDTWEILEETSSNVETLGSCQARAADQQ
jgi:hypothetical protein